MQPDLSFCTLFPEVSACDLIVFNYGGVGGSREVESHEVCLFLNLIINCKKKKKRITWLGKMIFRFQNYGNVNISINLFFLFVSVAWFCLLSALQ